VEVLDNVRAFLARLLDVVELLGVGGAAVRPGAGKIAAEKELAQRFKTQVFELNIRRAVAQAQVFTRARFALQPVAV
jgi:hypothetical protein